MIEVQSLITAKSLRYGVNASSSQFIQQCIDSINYVLSDVDAKLGTDTPPIIGASSQIAATASPSTASITVNDVATLQMLNVQLSGVQYYGPIALYDSVLTLKGTFTDYGAMLAQMIVTDVLQFTQATANQLGENLLKDVLYFGLDFYLGNMGLYTVKNPDKVQAQYESKLSMYTIRYLQTRRLNPGLGNLNQASRCAGNPIGEYWPGGIRVYG